MKKIKLLMPLLGIAATAGAVLPAVTSCANGGQEEKDKITVTGPTETEFVAKDVLVDRRNHLQAELTGFTVEGAKPEDLTVNVVTDAYVWFGELSASILPENDASKFKILLDVRDTYYLQPSDFYRIALDIRKGEDILYTSADLSVFVEEKIAIPAAVPTITAEPLATNVYGLQLTEAFEIRHYNEIWDELIPWIRFMVDGEDVSDDVIIDSIDYETGSASLIFYYEGEAENIPFSIDYKLGYYDESQEWVTVSSLIDEKTEHNSFTVTIPA